MYLISNFVLISLCYHMQTYYTLEKFTFFHLPVTQGNFIPLFRSHSRDFQDIPELCGLFDTWEGIDLCKFISNVLSVKEIQLNYGNSPT